MKRGAPSKPEALTFKELAAAWDASTAPAKTASVAAIDIISPPPSPTDAADWVQRVRERCMKAATDGKLEVELCFDGAHVQPYWPAGYGPWFIHAYTTMAAYSSDAMLARIREVARGYLEELVDIFHQSAPTVKAFRHGMCITISWTQKRFCK